MDYLHWLEQWYQTNCDGEWEHAYGIDIKTLDNPGWYLRIDLKETEYENLPDKELNQDNGDDDWLRCSIMDNRFTGYGDCLKLGKIIETFKSWIEF